MDGHVVRACSVSPPHTTSHEQWPINFNTGMESKGGTWRKMNAGHGGEAHGRRQKEDQDSHATVPADPWTNTLPLTKQHRRWPLTDRYTYTRERNPCAIVGGSDVLLPAPEPQKRHSITDATMNAVIQLYMQGQTRLSRNHSPRTHQSYTR